ncbi:hypothetical protein B0H13DRAFT_1880602 [Mycena leptocephala]|nr:hypothetical protein B0H13DRAFT_1880602 [Mycena leptocephala]
MMRSVGNRLTDGVIWRQLAHRAPKPNFNAQLGSSASSSVPIQAPPPTPELKAAYLPFCLPVYAASLRNFKVQHTCLTAQALKPSDPFKLRQPSCLVASQSLQLNILSQSQSSSISLKITRYFKLHSRYTQEQEQEAQNSITCTPRVVPNSHRPPSAPGATFTSTTSVLGSCASRRARARDNTPMASMGGFALVTIPLLVLIKIDSTPGHPAPIPLASQAGSVGQTGSAAARQGGGRPARTASVVISFAESCVSI